MDVSNEKYESFDPHYTVEISRRMRVPERLSIGPSTGPSPTSHPVSVAPAPNGPTTNETKKMFHEMAVPDKIVVAGYNQHLALRPEPRPLSDILTVATASASGAAGMALSDSQQASFVALPTPPRTLTVDTYLERTVERTTVTDDEQMGRQYSKSMSEAETPPGTSRLRRTESQLSTAMSNGALSGCEDDDTKLRRQMVRLARRVDWLEDENRRRSNRDLFYGTLIFGYAIFKVVAWLVKLPR